MLQSLGKWLLYTMKNNVSHPCLVKTKKDNKKREERYINITGVMTFVLS